MRPISWLSAGSSDFFEWFAAMNRSLFTAPKQDNISAPLRPVAPPAAGKFDQPKTARAQSRPATAGAGVGPFLQRRTRAVGVRDALVMTASARAGRGNQSRIGIKFT